MSKGSILVVDDESEIREGLELLLKTEGYQVASAETALSGLTRLEEKPFDLLLLDVSLPDRNGIELLKDVHRHDPHLPIVLITAYGSIEMARAAFKSGAMDYITKPWSNDELLALVAQVGPSRSTVLISGESGTGKELIAKAIHSASPRADKAFVPVNTGSIPV